jgi:hypothetical protein
MGPTIEQVSEPRLGIPARVMFAHAPPGRGLEPERVEHGQLGITWDVTGILDCWQHPGRAEQSLGRPTLAKWWLLKVCGPLPWCPADHGEFVMQVSRYGDRRLWWITVDVPGQLRRPAD